MTIEQLLSEWAIDSKIDPLKIEATIREIPSLHNKYLTFLVYENRKLRKLERERNSLVQLRTEYFYGDTLDNVELAAIRAKSKYPDSWHPFARRLVKTEISRFVDNAPDVQDITEEYGEQKQVVDALTLILKEIMQRNFHLRAIIDYKKFQEAVN